jgi:hypothetical protein
MRAARLLCAAARHGRTLNEVVLTVVVSKDQLPAIAAMLVEAPTREGDLVEPARAEESAENGPPH